MYLSLFLYIKLLILLLEDLQTLYKRVFCRYPKVFINKNNLNIEEISYLKKHLTNL